MSESPKNQEGDLDRQPSEQTPTTTGRQGREVGIPRILDVHDTIIHDTTLTIKTGQKVILITRDRIDITLRDTIPKLSELGTLLGKVGIFLALLLAVVTTEARDILGIQKATWTAIFVILTAVSLIWILYSAFRHIKRLTIKDIVDEIMKASEE